MKMRFSDPLFLYFILFIIPLLFLRRKGVGFKYSGLSIIKSVYSANSFDPRSLLKVLRVFTLILFVLALARPQAGREFIEDASEGVDIVLALDTSGSMRALDFKKDGENVNRLEIVKDVVKSFVKKRPSDRMGIVVFGEEAYTQCPLTKDHGILIEFLSKIEIGMAGDATAIGSAVGTSVKRVKDLKTKSKIVILLTDGRNNAGAIDPIKGAELAATFGIKVYTIGVGTKGDAPFLVDTFFGKKYVYQPVEIDEETLKQISSISGGKYFRATDTKELENIYTEIDKLEKTEVKYKQYTEYNELFHWFLLPGIMLLFLEIILGNTIFRKIP